MIRQFFSFIVLSAAISVHAASDALPPGISDVWAQNFFANPETFGADSSFNLAPLQKTAYRFDAGVYESIVSRLKIRIPRIGNEKTVSVREAVVFTRQDGQPGTTHVIFVPDPWAPAYETDLGVSAVVVTRLREDRSRDRESVLARFEPPSMEAREGLAKSGVSYARVASAWGVSTRRITVNRVFEEPFPYQTRQTRSPEGAVVRSVGVSRFLVVEEDSLLELSQVVPCGPSTAAGCTQQAIKVNDSFVDGLAGFLTYPKSPIN